MQRTLQLLLCVFCLTGLMAQQACYKSSLPETIHNKSRPIPPAPFNGKYPANFYWGDISGQSRLTRIQQQNLPHSCGSCWAFAAVSALNDRIKIRRSGIFPDIYLSPQVLVSCDPLSQGCQAGDPIQAYQYISEKGITDETCSPYLGTDSNKILTRCSSQLMCKQCDQKSCFAASRPQIYSIQSYGQIKNSVTQMMSEIYANGPITCGISLTDAFRAYKGGIFIDSTGSKDLKHAITIVGWGTTAGIKYWIGKNSWGLNWGEEGFFRIIRGLNNMGIESECSWADPTDTWTGNVKNETLNGDEGRILEYQRDFFSGFKKLFSSVNKQSQVVNPLDIPEKTISDYMVPNYLDWRNFEGKNHLTPVKNVDFVKQCGATWALAAAQTLSDRIRIKNIKAKSRLLVNLQPPQALFHNTCKERSLNEFFNYVFDNGITDDSCQSYEGGMRRLTSECQVCLPSDLNNNSGDEICSDVPSYRIWYLQEFGYITSPMNIKKEIMARGPIVCQIVQDVDFMNYKGGVFRKADALMNKLNERIYVQLTGWDRMDSGDEYWIGKGLWGTYWGEDGYFRINMRKDNLGIDKNCMWGDPDMKQVGVQEDPDFVDNYQSS